MISAIARTDLITSLTQINSGIPVTAILDSQNSLVEFEQGNKYQASVEARLVNGSARVLVADQFLQMHLPEKFQPGNKLELVFLSSEPKLKFLILGEAPFEKIKENNASISATGRFLGVLLQDALKHASTSTTQSLTSSSPILTGMLINSSELSGLLQKAIVQSGLFYESHQAQWINGKKTLENLHQEPQNKLMSVTVDSTAAKANLPALPGPDMPINAQNIPLVLQQLNILETGHLFWHGEVWQNQSMQWDIYERFHGSRENVPDSVIQWHTQIRLSMPKLGDITARITLNAQGIHIKLDASQLETASLLRNNQLPLATDMQSAGLTIQSIEVQHDSGK